MEGKVALTQGFVLCLNNQGYEASLEVGKLYRFIEDKEAASHGYARVVDESGEDYAYSNNRFFHLQLPKAVEEALMSFSEQCAA